MRIQGKYHDIELKTQNDENGELPFGPFVVVVEGRPRVEVEDVRVHVSVIRHVHCNLEWHQIVFVDFLDV